MRNLMELVGILAVVVGLGLAYLPLGVVMAGLILIVGAHLAEDGE